MKAKKKLPWAVFAAILLAIIIGPITGTTAGVFGITFYSIYDGISTLFLNALTLIVVPLVASSIISGIARLGSEPNFRKIALKTLGFYAVTIILAIFIGMLFVNIFKPGLGYLGQPLMENKGLALSFPTSEETTFKQFLFKIIPSTLTDILSYKRLLGLIFFSMLFGFALSKIETRLRNQLFNFWQAVFQTMIKVTEIILTTLPLAVFCLVARELASSGTSSFFSIFKFLLTVVVSSTLFMCVLLPLLLKFVGKINPWRHFKAMGPALITAFSTSSSSATLPITLDCVEKKAGVSNRIASLVVPLGTSINLSGSALYECVATLFIAQAYGVSITFTTQLSVFLLSLFTSIGVAGIPSASLVAITVILHSLGLPPEGIGLLLTVDRLCDMVRTTVNVFSDSCCAVLVAKSEGEKKVLV